jgi:hypothetical protein
MLVLRVPARYYKTPQYSGYLVGLLGRRVTERHVGNVVTW